MDLKDIRKRIDEVDGELITLFQKRMDIIKKVAEYKIQNGMQVLDSEREHQLIAKRVSEAAPEYKEYTHQFFDALLAVSRKMQHDMMGEAPEAAAAAKKKLPTVAYLGVPGSFSEQAVAEYFKDDAKAISVQTFAEIIAKVDDGTYDMAMIPVENSSTGSVNQTVDFLVNHDVSIIGEHIVKVRHYLLGTAGSSVGAVEQALSHPQALEQCADFLKRNDIAAIPVQSTADAAQQAAKASDKKTAAVASKRAAKLYGLNILAEDIQTNNSNYTRFVAIAKNPPPIADADKISIICAIEHKPGTLHNLIDIFSRYELNLLQLFSRPIPNVPWQYRFHLDFSGNLADEKVQDALKEAQEYCTEIKILGNYRSYKSDAI